MGNQKPHVKDFNSWNHKKKQLDSRILPDDFFFLEGEVWWASLGINIGSEIDGKNELFERPVIVLRKLNEDLLWVLPITTTERTGEYFHQITYKGENRTVLLQIRTVSGKRLLRLIYRMNDDEFKAVQNRMLDTLCSIKAIPSG